MAEAKRLGAEYAGREQEMPADTMAAIDAQLGKADEVKARMDLAQRMQAGDAFLNEPAGVSVTQSTFREAGPNEGNAPVDVKAWRSMKVATLFGEREFRYHVPLTVQAKDYVPAFESYLRKGFEMMGPNDRKTLIEGQDTAGGFTVPEDFQAELIKKIATDAMIRSLARVVQTSRDIVSWPRVNYTSDDKYTSGVRLTWSGEQPSSSTAHRVTDPVFGKINIPVHTAMASLPLSNDLIEDSVFDVVGLASDLMGEAFALGEDDAFINGNGSGRPMGILAEVNGNGPAYVVSGTNGALSTSGDAHSGNRLLDLYYAVPSQYRRRGVWIANSGTLKEIDNLVDAQKRPILQALTTGSVATGEPSVIKGRPIIVDEFMPDLATDAYSVAFGDVSSYIVLERVALAVQRLLEVDAQSNNVILLARRRVGGYLAEPYRMKVLKAGTS